jgi:hypothetical protein
MRKHTNDSWESHKKKAPPSCDGRGEGIGEGTGELVAGGAGEVDRVVALLQGRAGGRLGADVDLGNGFADLVIHGEDSGTESNDQNGRDDGSEHSHQLLEHVASVGGNGEKRGCPMARMWR